MLFTTSDCDFAAKNSNAKRDPAFQVAHDMLDLRPGFSTVRFHKVEIVRIFPLADPILVARPCFDARVPVHYLRPAIYHAQNIEMLQARYIRR
jgi:hypothetical protein